MKSSEELFQEWKQKRHSYKLFCEDGILLESKWEKSNPKILFLIQETYRHLIHFKGQIVSASPKCTFLKKLYAFAYIITEYLNDRVPELNTMYKIKDEPNESIAIVSIKKHVQKIAKDFEFRSNDEEILNYARNDKDFLIRQIGLIKPDVIFCCGTFHCAKELFPNLLNISKGVYAHEKILLIHYEKPSNIYGYEHGFDCVSSFMEGYKRAANELK